MHWSRNAICYQIYPASFKDSDGDGTGDLAGILQNIDYLNGGTNSLGVNAVWLCPFYPSPMHDFGYDVEDFTGVNSLFGSMEIFEKLVKELHARGIKVIIDFVGNHTSDKHPWFVEARSSRESAKRDWYIWRDADPAIGLPNNWLSVFGGSAWELDQNSDQYYFHSFLKQQPDLNWRNTEVQDAMSSVVDFWVNKGVDGFRIDAFMHFVEDKLFRDDPVNPLYRADAGKDPFESLIHIHSLGEMDRANIIGQFFTKIMARHPDILIVNEAYVGPTDLRRIHDICPNERFTVFNFNFISKPWDALEYKKAIDEYLVGTQAHFLPNFVNGNHDVSRIVSRIGEAQARLSAFLQFTLPGMPFVYYGEELGMTDATIPPHAIRDTIAKLFGGTHKGRDPERTPMQWNDSPHAGFMNTDTDADNGFRGKPWLPVNDNYKTINIAHELTDPQSMLSLYRNLINFRGRTETIRFGRYVPVDSHSSDVLSFEIRNGTERLLVALNFSSNVARELIPQDISSNTTTDTNTAASATLPAVIFSTANHINTATLPRALELMPYEGYVVKLSE